MGEESVENFWGVEKMIIQALVPTFHNLQKPLEVDIEASQYARGAVLMVGSKPVWYHSKMFLGGVLNYPTYDKKLYHLVQVVKKWKHYLMIKETIIHTDNQPL